MKNLTKVVAIFALAATSATAAYAEMSANSSFFGITVVASTNPSNPTFGNPYGTATTQASASVSQLGATCTVHNSDGSTYTTPKANATNSTIVTTAQAKANTYFSSGVSLTSAHSILDSRNGGWGWGANTDYTF